MNYQPNPIHIGSESLPEPDLEKLYDKDIFVCFDGHAVAIPFDTIVKEVL